MKCLFEELSNRKQGDEILLFSPGMPSFDNFANFEHRGRFFKDKVKDFLSEKEKEY
jgi:UDP-N-acetylmuramoylalanine-D-glutamate ligase